MGREVAEDETTENATDVLEIDHASLQSRDLGPNDLTSLPSGIFDTLTALIGL